VKNFHTDIFTSLEKHADTTTKSDIFKALLVLLRATFPGMPRASTAKIRMVSSQLLTKPAEP
jgi:hypothetical protein